MKTKERRKNRRETNRATLGSVAAAPSFQAVKKKRGKRSRLHWALASLVMISVPTTVLFVAPTAAHAGFTDAPEIDPGSLAGAMTLLVGGVLALTDRTRRS